MPFADPAQAKEYRKARYWFKKENGLIDHKGAVVRSTKWRKAHPEQALGYQRAHYNRHKDEINAKRREEHDPEYHRASEAARRERMKADPELKQRRLESHRRSYERRREKCIEQRKLYQAAHPDKVRQYTRTTNFRRKQVSGFHTTSQWVARFHFYGGRCAYCACVVTLESAHRDHVIPLSKGGTNWAANLAPACKQCNLRKHMKRWLPLWLGQEQPRVVMKES